VLFDFFVFFCMIIFLLSVRVMSDDDDAVGRGVASPDFVWLARRLR
jgi:hypothetical protein